jgi:hypothetical protein
VSPGVSGARAAVWLSLAFVVLLGSQVLVVWRQARVLETQRLLDGVRAERAVVASEFTGLSARILALESRAHVVPAAERRLGLRVPRGEEIVLLPVPRGGGGTD